MAKPNKILLVEDEPTFIIGTTTVLEAEGYEVSCATNGEQALSVYEAKQPDLILLDIHIPKKNGFEVCKEIRKDDPDTLIIMLTNREKDADKVLGLELGADDYVVKGISFEELFARINAAFRRGGSKESSQKILDEIAFGDIHIDTKTLKGTKKDVSFEVSMREIEILQIFLQKEGDVVTRDELLEELWGTKNTGTTRVLDQLVLKIRKKIEEDPSNPTYIHTVHGTGYRFISV
jgi:DNA-binding response OmpR family regulator